VTHFRKSKLRQGLKELQATQLLTLQHMRQGEYQYKLKMKNMWVHHHRSWEHQQLGELFLQDQELENRVEHLLHVT
jgi:hypothetical protein